MYKNLQLLSPEKHSDLQLKPYDSFSFAEGLSIIPLASGEIVEASKYYPIVFSNTENTVPIAVVSFTDKNIFINSQGQWLVPYIPARVRTYPFALVPTDKDGQYAVAIDIDAPHFVEEGGELLFDAKGKTSPWLGQVVQYLLGMQQGYQVAQTFGSTLKRAGLIADRRVDITLKNGERRNFQGFLCVDEEAINALSDERKKEMEINGEMALLKAHHASLANFERFFV